MYLAHASPLLVSTSFSVCFLAAVPVFRASLFPPLRLPMKLSVGPGLPFLFRSPGPVVVAVAGWSGRCGPGGGSSRYCRCSSSVFHLNSSRKLLVNEFAPSDTGLKPLPDTSSSPLLGDILGPDSAHRLSLPPPPVGPGASWPRGSTHLPRAAILSPGAVQRTLGRLLRPCAWSPTCLVLGNASDYYVSWHFPSWVYIAWDLALPGLGLFSFPCYGSFQLLSL